MWRTASKSQPWGKWHPCEWQDKDDYFYLGLAQAGLPEDVSRAECDARRNCALTDLKWFNKIHFAAEPLFYMASRSEL